MTTPAAPYRDSTRSLLAIPLLLSVLAAGCDQAGAPETPVVDASALDADHRRAAGLLARYEYADAVDLLEQVVADDPDRLDARIDLAIAVMNRQLEDDEQNALDMIDALAEAHPEDARAAYVAGVLLQRAGEDERAEARFDRVVEADPDDAYGWYHLGLVRERETPAEAMAAY